MTNEEKTKEILDCENCKKQLFIGGVKCPPTCADYNDLMKMAQWKDEQFLTMIRNLAKEYLAANAIEQLTDEEVSAKLATLKRIEEEMK